MQKFERVRAELGDVLPTSMDVGRRSVAVLLPCYNEEATVADTVRGFAEALPGARIYVYDNNSSDRTVERAEAAGAIVRREPLQGKGNVVRRMFSDIDADIYVMADGDLTYDPTAASALIERLVRDNLDMVVATRKSSEEEAYRRGHRLGNRLFNKIVGRLFGRGFTDIFSGYRVMSHRFAKSFPAESAGFEIETELSVHALDMRIATAEIAVPYGTRPPESMSKLRTYRDGARILWTIAMMFRALKPFRFFGAIAACLALASLALGIPVVEDYLQTGLVKRFPTAILAMGVMQLAFLSLVCGIVVEAVSEGRREHKRLRYLELSSVVARRALAS